MDPVTGFAAAAVRIATPLLWASLGEVVAERAGVINLSVEGAMLVGCLASAVAAQDSVPVASSTMMHPTGNRSTCTGQRQCPRWLTDDAHPDGLAIKFRTAHRMTRQ